MDGVFVAIETGATAAVKLLLGSDVWLSTYENDCGNISKLVFEYEVME